MQLPGPAHPDASLDWEGAFDPMPSPPKVSPQTLPLVPCPEQLMSHWCPSFRAGVIRAGTMLFCITQGLVQPHMTGVLMLGPLTPTFTEAKMYFSGFACGRELPVQRGGAWAVPL